MKHLMIACILFGGTAFGMQQARAQRRETAAQAVVTALGAFVGSVAGLGIQITINHPRIGNLEVGGTDTSAVICGIIGAVGAYVLARIATERGKRYQQE